MQDMDTSSERGRKAVPAILTHALAVEGGVTKLAAAMGVTPGAVSQWKIKMPASAGMELLKRYGRRKVPKSPLDWKPKEQR